MLIAESDALPVSAMLLILPHRSREVKANVLVSWPIPTLRSYEAMVGRYFIHGGDERLHAIRPACPNGSTAQTLRRTECSDSRFGSQDLLVANFLSAENMLLYIRTRI